MDLKQRAVNVRMRYEIPKDRWILLVRGNPLMGSQVRFWSYCIAVLIGAWLLGRGGWCPGPPGLKRWQWFLLGLGLTQVGPWTILWAVLWLFALEWKRRHYPRQGWFGFDLVTDAACSSPWPCSSPWGSPICTTRSTRGC